MKYLKAIAFVYFVVLHYKMTTRYFKLTRQNILDSNAGLRLLREKFMNY